MKRMKRFIMATTFVLALPCLAGCGERPVYVGTFVAVNKAIAESLTENDISYTVEYPSKLHESEDEVAIYVIETDASSAEIKVERRYSLYYVSFSITDYERNLEGQVYGLIDVMDVAYFGIYNDKNTITLDYLMQEKYLIEETQIQKVFGYEKDTWSFKFVMSEDYYALTMEGSVWEEFTYM